MTDLWKNILEILRSYPSKFFAAVPTKGFKKDSLVKINSENPPSLPSIRKFLLLCRRRRSKNDWLVKKILKILRSYPPLGKFCYCADEGGQKLTDLSRKNSENFPSQPPLGKKFPPGMTFQKVGNSNDNWPEYSLLHVLVEWRRFECSWRERNDNCHEYSFLHLLVEWRRFEWRWRERIDNSTVTGTNIIACCTYCEKGDDSICAAKRGRRQWSKACI